MKIADRHLWQRFLAIATPYWREDERWRARGLLLLLVVLLLGQTQFAVLFIRQTAEFTSALAARDTARFWEAIRYCLILLVVAVPIYAFYYFVRDTLGIQWRRWLTGRFLRGYFSHRHFYELNANAEIDNPDQRVAEDIATFTQRSLYFLLVIIGSIVQMVLFSRVLWSISHELVYFLVFYATAGTLVTILVFGKVLIGLNFNQLRREADFRYSLVRVRENAESIAFYRGEVQELQQVSRRFTAAFNNFKQLIRRQLGLNFFQHAYNLLTIVVPSAIIAPRVLSGELEVGAVVQAAGAFAAVLSAISLIVENFEGLSRFSAGIDRLSTLSKVLPASSATADTGDGTISLVEGDRLCLERVTLQTPRRERVLPPVEPGAGEAGLDLCAVGAPARPQLLPGVALGGTGAAGGPVERQHIVGHEERLVRRKAHHGLRGGDLLGAEGRPVGLGRVREVGGGPTDVAAQHQQRRLAVRGDAAADGSLDRRPEARSAGQHAGRRRSPRRRGRGRILSGNGHLLRRRHRRLLVLGIPPRNPETPRTRAGRFHFQTPSHSRPQAVQRPFASILPTRDRNPSRSTRRAPQSGQNVAVASSSPRTLPI